MSKPKSPRKVGDREALAVATSIRGSAYKLNLVAGLIRGRKVGEALNILQFSTKAMAVDVRKVLASAVANAENNHNLDVDALIVKEASVGKALVMCLSMRTAAVAGSAPAMAYSSAEMKPASASALRMPGLRLCCANIRRSGTEGVLAGS